MMYFGRVTRTAEFDQKVYVKIQALGGSHEFGPLPIVIPAAYIPAWGTSSNYVGHHGYHSHIVNADPILLPYPFAKDDLVVVAQIGHIKEDLIVLGKVKPPTPPSTGSNT